MDNIHIHETSGLPVLPDDGTGTPRMLARLEPMPGKMMTLASFGDVHPIIPQDQWVDIDLYASYNPPVLDQGQTGSCVGHGCTTAFTLAYMMQGEPLTRFSSCYLYSLLNGGSDGGASIGDSINALMTKGVCLETTVPEGYIFRRQYNTTKADAEATHYKLIEAYKFTTPEEKASAIQMGFSGADSVCVGRSFNGLNYKGVPGLAGVDRGAGNHCTGFGGMKKLPSGLWVYVHQNSWSTSWNPAMKGRYYTCDDHIENQSYFEGVVYRVVSSGPLAPSFAA